MKVPAFLRLIRWPNLVFIALTQVLFYYCIYWPLYHLEDIRRLAGLVLASGCIAAAGYIINDYFDLNIDQINKPGKNVFSRSIHRRWAIIWHLTLSFLGVLATALAVGLHQWYLILANAGCVALLWMYSTSFKRELLIGNVAISLLTSWTVLVIFFACTDPSNAVFSRDPLSLRFFKIAFLYAGFAFISSLIREAVKDMEDLTGDARYGCRTLPIVAGNRATKIYVTVWTVVLLAALIVLCLYMLQLGWWLAVLYSVLLIMVPVSIFFIKLFRAQTQGDFAYLSNLAKLIMLTGILSMIFFRLYF